MILVFGMKKLNNYDHELYLPSVHAFIIRYSNFKALYQFVAMYTVVKLTKVAAVINSNQRQNLL